MSSSIYSHRLYQQIPNSNDKRRRNNDYVSHTAQRFRGHSALAKEKSRDYPKSPQWFPPVKIQLAALDCSGLVWAVSSWKFGRYAALSVRVARRYAGKRTRNLKVAFVTDWRARGPQADAHNKMQIRTAPLWQSRRRLLSVGSLFTFQCVVMWWRFGKSLLN